MFCEHCRIFAVAASIPMRMLSSCFMHWEHNPEAAASGGCHRTWKHMLQRRRVIPLPGRCISEPPGSLLLCVHGQRVDLTFNKLCCEHQSKSIRMNGSPTCHTWEVWSRVILKIACTVHVWASVSVVHDARTLQAKQGNDLCTACVLFKDCYLVSGRLEIHRLTTSFVLLAHSAMQSYGFDRAALLLSAMLFALTLPVLTMQLSLKTSSCVSSQQLFAG